jgi:anti-sigma-K factor RskA
VEADVDVVVVVAERERVLPEVEQRDDLVRADRALEQHQALHGLLGDAARALVAGDLRRRGAAGLAELVEPVPLPEGFEETILTKVRAERPETSAPRERRWWRARRPLIAGAAAVLVGVLGFTTVSYVGSRARQRQYQETVAALVHDPDAFTLTGAGGAEAVLASTSTGSVLVAVDLGEAPAGRDYQLWLMKDGTPSSAGTFDVSDSVVIIEYDDPISGYDGAAVTVEPDGGSDAPTTDPVLSS